MKPIHSSEHAEPDQEIVDILKDLGTLKSAYPPDLLRARRAAFVAQVEQMGAADEEASSEDQDLVRLIGGMGSIQAEYPPELLAARRVALFNEVERAGGNSLLNRLRVAMRRVLPVSAGISTARLSLVIASLAVAVCLVSVLLPRAGQLFHSSPQDVLQPDSFAPSGTGEVAIIICQPGDQTSPCQPGGAASDMNLADSANGSARPAVANDASQMAPYLNDGNGGASWVSNSADSWIKIDLGEARTINTISLQKGRSDPAGEPGQFVIAVALSDVYADGDSSQDYTEYAQVFHSEGTGFSRTVSQTETIQIRFPAVRARFVKLTFEKPGAALEEVGVFLVEPSRVTTQDDTPGTTLTPAATATPLAVNTVTSAATQPPTGATALSATATSSPGDTPTPTHARPASNTPTSLPTRTPLPTDTATTVPTQPPPSNTPIPLPTAVPATEVVPTVQLPVDPEPIIVTGSSQSLTFVCNGNAVEIRGHTNTVTLLGSCSSITVTGNGNQVFWESGSPVITNRGKENIIQQL